MLEAYEEAASRATHTWKAEEGSFLASSSFLVFPAVFGFSQPVGSSLQTLPRSSHSILLCLSGSVSCISFLYKDSSHIEFRPSIQDSAISPSLSNLQACYFQSGYVVSTAIPHRTCPVSSHLRSQCDYILRFVMGMDGRAWGLFTYQVQILGFCPGPTESQSRSGSQEEPVWELTQNVRRRSQKSRVFVSRLSIQFSQQVSGKLPLEGQRKV